MNGSGSVVVSTRLSPVERAQVATIAVKEGLSVSELVGRIVVAEVQDRLRHDLAASAGGRQ